jgi:hypothetical protein
VDEEAVARAAAVPEKINVDRNEVRSTSPGFSLSVYSFINM